MLTVRKYAITFRPDETTFVTQRWKADESCSLIGVGSVGKSNLLQHLSSEDIHQHYMLSTQKFKTITLDSNMLGPLNDSEQFRCWAGYELMMHRLYLAFYPFDILEDDAQSFYETYQALQDGTNPLYAYMGLRYLELGIEFFTRRGWKIVFMFDEFEEFLKQMPSRFFQSLRGLRDNRKQSLSYLTFSREPLSVLIEKMELSAKELEPFVELFTGNEYFVGPYNFTDSVNMLQSLAKRHQITLSSELHDFLINISGGFAGLLRACFHALPTISETRQPSFNTQAVLSKIVSRRAVQEECKTLWNGLTQEEQTAIKVAFNPQEYHDSLQPALDLLVQKRLLHVTNEGGLTIAPPVFLQYIRTKEIK